MSYFYSHENLNQSLKTGVGQVKFSELQIFDKVPIQSEIESAYYEKVFPLDGGLTIDAKDLVFHIRPNVDLISLDDSYIEMTLQIQKKTSDGTYTNPLASDKITITNLPLYALFSDLTVEVNSKQVHNTYSLYHLQTYFQLLLNMSPASLPKWAGACGYYGDSILTQTTGDQASGDAAMASRYARFSEGKKVTLIGPLLSSGVTNLGKIFPSLTDIKFTFRRHSNHARTVTQPTAAKDEYIVKIVDAALHCKRIKPYANILSSIESRLNSKTAAPYFFDHHVTRSWTIEKGTNSKRIENLLKTNYAPKEMIVGFMDSNELQGSTGASGFQFAHHNVKELYFQTGSEIYPRRIFTPGKNLRTINIS